MVEKHIGTLECVCKLAFSMRLRDKISVACLPVA